MKRIRDLTVAVTCLLATPLWFGCEVPYSVTTSVGYRPPWAPPYVPGVRYYYFPDIEVYYDMTDEEFIYLNDGQWYFSHTFPSGYIDFDLYNGFVISLNTGVYRPWLHHQFYVSHYPRYYYRHLYRDRDIRTLRGFNENDRKPIIWQPGERERQQELRRTERPVRNPDVQKPPQIPKYHKPVGEPVKVRPFMRAIKEKVKKPAGN